MNTKRSANREPVLPAAKGEPGDSPVGRVLGRGSIYTIATGLQLGAAILVLPALTRILAPDQYALVAAALIVYWLVGGSVGLGMPAAIARAYFRPGGVTGVKVLTLASLLIAAAVTAIIDITGPLWSQVFADIPYGGALRLAVLAGIPLTALTATQQVLRSQERAWAFVATAGVATAGGQTAGLVGASIDGADGYMLGLLLGTSAAAMLGLGFTGLRRISRDTRPYIRRNLLIGLPLVPHAVAMYVLAAGDRIVVERLEGLLALGAYTIAYTVGWIAVILAIALNNAWVPTVFGSDEVRRWAVLADTTSAIAGVMGAVAAGLAFAAPVILGLIAPADYEVAGLGRVSALVAASVIPYVWYLANAQVVFWVGRTGVLAWTTPLVASVNIILNLALIPSLGLSGAAVATLLSYVLLAALVWRRARQLADVPWQWGQLGLASSLSFTAIGLAMVLPDDGIGAFLRVAAASTLAALVLAAVARHGHFGSVAVERRAPR